MSSSLFPDPPPSFPFPPPSRLVKKHPGFLVTIMLAKTKVPRFVVVCRSRSPATPPMCIPFTLPQLWFILCHCSLHSPPFLAGTGVHKLISMSHLCVHAFPFPLSAFVVLPPCLLLPTISSGFLSLLFPLCLLLSLCRTCLCTSDRHTTHRASFVYMCHIPATLFSPVSLPRHPPPPSPSHSPSWSSPFLFTPV